MAVTEAVVDKDIDIPDANLVHAVNKTLSPVDVKFGGSSVTVTRGVGLEELVRNIVELGRV